MKFAFQDGLVRFKDTTEFYLKLKSWGFDAVEVMGQELSGRIEGIKSASAAAGLPVCAICPGLDGIRGSLLSDDASERKTALNDIISLLRCGAALGGAGLNIVPEFGGAKFMKLHPDYGDFDNRKQLFIDRLAPAAEEARKLGVPILLEPLNRYEAYFLITLGQAAEICAKFPSGEVKILADLFHINIEEDDIVEALTRNAGHIGHVHLSDSNRRLPGQGHTDFGAALHALKSAGYNGYASMECAVLGNPDETAPASLKFLKSL